ncbi:MAG: hydantoinase/oxoprolinase family protein [Archaeoglobaceae archaeon]|nr:hydantoinase/oxoprolinase family protein [Archaeoglobaceae archaeon]MDW8117628.1 hydantoinase/oxoprolinase family protein [Archaeoglobaceae archaeon]
MIGINIGGVNTVCAIVDENDIRTFKKPSEFGLESILMEKSNEMKKESVIVSTSLPVNHILLNFGTLKTLTLLIPGPGLNYSNYGHLLKGYVNHRGDLVEKIDEDEVKRVLENSEYNNVAIASKFSVRNPILEEEVKKIVLEKFDEKKVALSHFVGGLNYPARINTTVINAKLKELIWDLTEILQRNIPNFYYLLGNGSTSAPKLIVENPSELYNSSSVASAFGAIFLTGIGDGVVVDLGGFSTNLIPIENGKPRFISGIEIMGEKTLIRSIDVITVPIGGNSVISGGRILFDFCKPLAFGGDKFTITDAMNRMGYEIGNYRASRNFLEKVDHDVALEQFFSILVKNLKEMNAEKIIGAGYLAPFLVPEIAKKAKISYVIPCYCEEIGAIGSAVSRISFTLHARFDTEKGIAIYNGIFEKSPFGVGSIPREEEIIDAARKKMIEIAKAIGGEIEEIKVLDFYSFTIVKKGMKRGLIADVTMQIEPGVRLWKKS